VKNLGLLLDEVLVASADASLAVGTLLEEIGPVHTNIVIVNF